uniref:Family with sequence similarity 126 member A n=1 Tax=Eptatretus burgeri TaxID=7764 RepID=A0A8C4R6C4_EPTBU
MNALSECDIPCYAKTINGNTLIINALHEVLGERANELLEPMCHQLAQFCCAEQQELCLFTFQFLPELIWKHLSGVARQDKPSQSCVEGLLLEMYNLDVRDPDGDMMSSFVVPSLLQPSIYHEPCAFGSFGFTDYVIQQSKVKKLVYRQAIHHHEWITAQNRFQVLTFLLQYYNMHITSMRQSSICSFCKVFSSYNGEWDIGKRALEDILYRAKFDLLFEPLLLGRAIRNALLWDAPHCLRKGSVCVSLDLNTTPRRASQTVVTSASIRGHRWKKEGIDMSPVELFHEDILAERWPIMDIARPHTTNIAEQKQEGCDSWVDVHREAPLEVVAEDESISLEQMP